MPSLRSESLLRMPSCNPVTAVFLVQYLPSHEKHGIGPVRARPKAHSLILHFLHSVPEQTFFLVVHELIHAHVAFFIIPSIRVSSPSSTAVNSFYTRSVLATEWYSGLGPDKENHLPELLYYTDLLVC